MFSCSASRGVEKDGCRSFRTEGANTNALFASSYISEESAQAHIQSDILRGFIYILYNK